jgi:hypothetical protein
LLLSRLEEKTPQWVGKAQHMSIDLAKLGKVNAQHIFNATKTFKQIVVGVRPLLFAAYVNTPRFPLLMLEGIHTLFLHSVPTGHIQCALHISLVAALDHSRAQTHVKEDDPIPLISAI